MDPIDLYAKIQFIVQKEIEDAIAHYASQAKYNVSQVPAHEHTGVDSAKINYSNIEGIPTITGYAPIDSPTFTGTVYASGKFRLPVGTNLY